VGGAATRVIERVSSSKGSSPRGRGSRKPDCPACSKTGFIPAWAGQPCSLLQRVPDARVHPRVGGAAAQRVAGALPLVGSSPRGRGSQRRSPLLKLAKRFIPAWAGQPALRRLVCRHIQVHPRVGGAAYLAPYDSGGSRGSSPRGRGSLGIAVTAAIAVGFIPAWAGQPKKNECVSERAVHPRVGGAARQAKSARSRLRGSSPRGRGSPEDCSREQRRRRFIPAWAGQPIDQCPSRR